MTQNLNTPKLPPNFKNILFCTDFSESADFAFLFAIKIALENPENQLFLLHVIPEIESQFWKSYIYEVGDVDSKARSDLDQKIQQSYTSKLPENINLHSEFRIGKDSQEILDFTQQKQIDLIVIGHSSTSLLQKTFFGDITEKIARKAKCPVLIIPLSYKNQI